MCIRDSLKPVLLATFYKKLTCVTADLRCSESIANSFLYIAETKLTQNY